MVILNILVINVNLLTFIIYKIDLSIINIDIHQLHQKSLARKKNYEIQKCYTSTALDDIEIQKRLDINNSGNILKKNDIVLTSFVVTCFLFARNILIFYNFLNDKLFYMLLF